MRAGFKGRGKGLPVRVAASCRQPGESVGFLKFRIGVWRDGSMLKMARYAAIPHANGRTHKIPIGVIEYLTGKREQDALDGKRCLFELLVVSHDELPAMMRPVIVAPSSGGEVRVGKKLLPDYPEEFSPGEYLVVLVTLLNG